MRSSPAPGTWTSLSCFAAAAISRVKASVTSTSTSDRLGTTPASSLMTTSTGAASRARTAGSSVAEKVPAKATRSMSVLLCGIVHRSGRKINYPGGNGGRSLDQRPIFMSAVGASLSAGTRLSPRIWRTAMARIITLFVCVVAMYVAAPGDAVAQAAKPNIVIIWGDDVGQSNISAYSHGLMGYKTPNIDRVAREGMMFTDSYAE